MDQEIEIRIRPEEIIEAISKMKKKEREDFLEDLLASVSPDYLKSIKQAREDYRSGRVKTHDDIFSS